MVEGVRTRLVTLNGSGGFKSLGFGFSREWSFARREPDQDRRGLRDEWDDLSPVEMPFPYSTGSSKWWRIPSDRSNVSRRRHWIRYR